MRNLLDFEKAVAKFDEQLKPIASKPVDLDDPNWANKLAESHPLDEAGVRVEAESLLTEVTDFYQNSDAEIRQAIRALFEKRHSFAWAATPPWALDTASGFQRQLLLFSILDQSQDTRDAILWLQDICAKAESAGVQIKPILAETAKLSSAFNKYGMGSTKDLLLKAR